MFALFLRLFNLSLRISPKNFHTLSVINNGTIRDSAVPPNNINNGTMLELMGAVLLRIISVYPPMQMNVPNDIGRLIETVNKNLMSIENIFNLRLDIKGIFRITKKVQGIYIQLWSVGEWLGKIR
jgi:hypothetical protein